ncbi:DMT family transporter [Candidatus Woesearchaeota archaeon]|nr:DMT family transporter [Candidatus Woesearchaeota archaeon]
MNSVMALSAAACYGAANVLIRRGLHGSNPHASLFFSLLTNSVVMFAMVLAFVPLTLLLTLKAVAVFGVAGIIAPGLSRMLRYTSLERVGIARTGPISVISPVISTAIAVALLGEHLTFSIVAGTFLIIAGVFFASRRELDTNPKDMAFAFGAAVLVGIAMPARKYGLEVVDSPVMAGFVTAFVAFVMASLVISFTGNSRKIAPGDPGIRFYVFSGLLTSAGFVLNFMALSSGDVSVVGPLVQTTPLFALVFVQLFIRHLESVTKEIWVGTLVAVAGVVLVSV